MFEFDPKRKIRFEELVQLKEEKVFSFFEPYGLRFHASIRSETQWEKERTRFEKDFTIRKIDPTLEDVFIKAVEGKESAGEKSDE
jgi:hypothetical protein